jgi:hypothetical protein
MTGDLLPFDPKGLQPSDAVLAWCEQARSALEHARTLTETTKALTMVSVVADVTKRIEVSKEAATAASEVKLRWERRLGEVIATEREAGRLARRGQQDRSRHLDNVDTGDVIETLRDHGLSRDQAADAQRLAAIPENIFEQAVDDVKASGSTNITKPAVLRAANPDAARTDEGWWLEADKFTVACKTVTDRSAVALAAARFGKYPRTGFDVGESMVHNAIVRTLIEARSSIDGVLTEIRRQHD